MMATRDPSTTTMGETFELTEFVLTADPRSPTVVFAERMRIARQLNIASGIPCQPNRQRIACREHARNTSTAQRDRSRLTSYGLPLAGRRYGRSR